MARIFIGALALACFSCGETPSIDIGGSTPVGTLELQVVDTIDDSGAVFSHCRVAYDDFGAPHVAYRYRGPTSDADFVDALRYAGGGSGKWRGDEVGRFAAMRPGFDLALEGRKPHILFAATGTSATPELVEAARDNGGNWSQSILETNATGVNGVRYLGQPTVDGLRAVLPAFGTAVFRDASVRFDEWEFESVGALEPDESVLSFDAAMDREGGVHVCAVIGGGATERLFYASEELAGWEVREALRGALAPTCRIGAGAPGLPAIAVLDESRAGQTLTVIRRNGFDFSTERAAAASQMGDFDIVVGREGRASVAWVDVPSAELRMAFEVDGYEETSIANTDFDGSAALALAPDGSVAFCSERSERTLKEVIFGRVARTER